MANTTRYTWHTPNASDVPDVPGDLAELANAVEATVGGMDDRLTTLTGLSQSIFQYTTLTRVSSNILTVPEGQWYALSFDAVQYNLPTSTPGFVAASPTRITCHQTGLYRISGFAGFAMNPNGGRAVAVRVNGNASYPAIQSGLAPDDIEWYGSVNVEARVTVTDFIEFVVRQTSGGPLKLDTVQPRFSMQRLV